MAPRFFLFCAQGCVGAGRFRYRDPADIQGARVGPRTFKRPSHGEGLFLHLTSFQAAGTVSVVASLCR